MPASDLTKSLPLDGPANSETPTKRADRVARARLDEVLVLAAIDLDHRIEAALRADRPEATDSISGRKLCPPNPELTVITRNMSPRCRTYSTSYRFSDPAS
jgi:hypothetical protein